MDAGVGRELRKRDALPWAVRCSRSRTASSHAGARCGRSGARSRSRLDTSSRHSPSAASGPGVVVRPELGREPTHADGLAHGRPRAGPHVRGHARSRRTPRGPAGAARHGDHGPSRPETMRVAVRRAGHAEAGRERTASAAGRPCGPSPRHSDVPCGDQETLVPEDSFAPSGTRLRFWDEFHYVRPDARTYPADDRPPAATRARRSCVGSTATSTLSRAPPRDRSAWAPVSSSSSPPTRPAGATTRGRSRAGGRRPRTTSPPRAAASASWGCRRSSSGWTSSRRRCPRPVKGAGLGVELRPLPGARRSCGPRPGGPRRPHRGAGRRSGADLRRAGGRLRPPGHCGGSSRAAGARGGRRGAKKPEALAFLRERIRAGLTVYAWARRGRHTGWRRLRTSRSTA